MTQHENSRGERRMLFTIHIERIVDLLDLEGLASQFAFDKNGNLLLPLDLNAKDLQARLNALSREENQSLFRHLSQLYSYAHDFGLAPEDIGIPEQLQQGYQLVFKHNSMPEYLESLDRQLGLDQPQEDKKQRAMPHMTPIQGRWVLEKN